jgi:hypothetical protein
VFRWFYFAGEGANDDIRILGYWRDRDQSPIHPELIGTHWNSNAETDYLTGKGIDNAMGTLMGVPSSASE